MIFQSTLPRGERRNFFVWLFKSNNFNPRSREGSDRKQLQDMLDVVDFNPRSREGSDDHYDYLFVRLVISIHAPARGATFLANAFIYTYHIFQSTLPRGERHELAEIPDRESRISIHAPARGATFKRRVQALTGKISIHAPARGATPGCGSPDIHRIFQSTLPRGERRSSRPERNPEQRFQSTLPRGERLVTDILSVLHLIFQSTLPRGERPTKPDKYSISTAISIHAPARGATGVVEWGVQVTAISIHAPARGATAWSSFNALPMAISIHAPARGATVHYCC